MWNCTFGRWPVDFFSLVDSQGIFCSRYRRLPFFGYYLDTDFINNCSCRAYTAYHFSCQELPGLPETGLQSSCIGFKQYTGSNPDIDAIFGLNRQGICQNI